MCCLPCFALERGVAEAKKEKSCGGKLPILWQAWQGGDRANVPFARALECSDEWARSGGQVIQGAFEAVEFALCLYQHAL